MREWVFWDWAGYTILWIAIALSAIDQAFKLMPELAAHLEPAGARAKMYLRAGLAFSPLVFLIIATVILLARVGGLGVYGGMNENFVIVAGWSRWQADGV
jgi:hypothetical protein